MTDWFLTHGGETRGPLDEERLRELVRTGELSATDLLWHEGLAMWTPVGELWSDLFVASAPLPTEDLEGEGDSGHTVRMEVGLAGYQRYQEQLADQISVREASQAQAAFERGRRGLLVASLFLAVVLFVLPLVAEIPGWAGILAGVLNDASHLPVYGAALVLVAWARVPFAGRLLGVTSLLAGSGALMLMDPEALFVVAGPILALLGGMVFGLGWLLDAAADPVAARRRPWAARFKLALFGLGTLPLTFLSAGGQDHPWATYVAGVLLTLLSLVWHFFPGPHLARLSSELEPDAERVLRAAWRRWGFQVSGRVLAVVLALFPLLLFLNSLGLEQRLNWPARAEDGIVTPDGRAWFWRPGGRFLAPRDLAQLELYGVCPAGQDAGAKQELDTATRAAAQDIEDEARVARVRALLAGRRLQAPAGFAALAKGCAAPSFVWIGTAAVRPDAKHPQGRRVTWVSVLGLLTPLQARDVADIGANLAVLRWLLAVCGLVTFVLLWRRGGDSPLARALGLWLVGVGSLATAPYADYFLSSFRYGAWLNSLTSPFSGPLTLAVLTAEAGAWITIGVVPLSAALVFVHACWPLPDGVSRLERAFGLVGRLAVLLLLEALVLTVATVISIAILALVLRRDVTPQEGLAPSLVLFGPLYLGAGALLRLRTAARSEVPHVGWLGGLSFWLVLAVLSAALVAGGSPDAPDWVATLGIGLALLLGACALWLFVPRNFLNVAGGRDLAYLLLVVVLPMLFEVSEGLADVILSGMPLASDQAKSLLGLVIVVALLGPIQKLVEGALSRLAVKRLDRVAGAVEGALEQLIEAEGQAGARERAAQAFAEIGFKDYLLYARGSGGKLRLTLEGSLHEAPHDPAAELSLSSSLRDHLGARAGRLIDLGRVALEWEHFFFQFELARVRRRTGCRYLLPFALGNSLRGLIALPEAAVDERSCRDAVSEQAGRLGAALAEKR